MSEDPEALELRELTGALAVILDETGRAAANQQTEPFAILNVDVDGNISTFSPELLGVRHEQHGDFVFGNVHEVALLDIAHSVNFQRVREEIAEGVRLCAETCPYFSVCRGGAPVNKLFENGGFASTETLFCRLTKQAVIDVVLSGLEGLLKLLPDENRSSEARMRAGVCDG
jgi:uncharacterized protein